MKNVPIIVAAIVVLGLAAVLMGTGGDQVETTEEVVPQMQKKEEAALPRLVDLGAGICIPCKMMAPILKEMKKEYQGRMEVTFIDVWENPSEGKKYGVESIPTRIFYDPEGEELFRHVGFFSKEEILGKWKDFGFDFEAKDNE